MRIVAVTAAGTLVALALAPGASAAEGDVEIANTETVQVYTSDGSGAAQIPDVTGQSIGNATKALTRAGFAGDKVSVTAFTAGDGKNQCRVASTDPAAATTVAKDSAVGLTLYGNAQGADPGNCK